MSNNCYIACARKVFDTRTNYLQFSQSNIVSRTTKAFMVEFVYLTAF